MRKKGFTLMELLFVMVILAILVILIYPRILNSYKDAKKSSFLTEAKSVYNEANKKFNLEIMKNNRLSLITTDDDSKLDIAKKKIKYCITLDDKGVSNLVVTNGEYYVEGSNNFINEAKLSDIKYGKFENFSCSYKLAKKDLLEDYDIKSVKASKKYKNGVYILGILFVITMVGSLISKGKVNR